MDSKKKIDYKKLIPFRFKKLDNRILITNDIGNHVFLEVNDFDSYLQGDIKKGSKVFNILKENNFIEDEVDLEELVEKYKNRKAFIMGGGPSLHIMVITQRCNHKCLYCHASAKDESEQDMDMTKDVARKALDMIFESTNETLVIEFQGGEPLLNWSVIDYIIVVANKMRKRLKKNLEFRLVTNLSLMSDKRLKFLLDNNVNICTSLDGPEVLHNKNRPLCKANGYEVVSDWIVKINKEYSKSKNNTKKLSSIPTISKNSLDSHKEIVDDYARNKFDAIFLRPLNPFGISEEKWKKIGYSADDYIEFYKKSLNYIIDLNLEGKRFIEKTTQFYLQKILTDTDPNYLEMRSPCGAGIGQLAYNYNGDVYTCDEGRMLSMVGDESFKIGNVFENSYDEIVLHTTTKTLCTASCLENLASCSDCAYLPYCGVCPIYNYFEQGNIYAQMARSERCKISTAILDYIFLKMEDKKIKNIFNNWIK